MAFITLANANKIIYRTDLRGIDLSGEVYKIPIHFFNKYEEQSLLAIQELLKDPENYFTEIYVPYEPVDTLKYVYEGNKPRYHKDSNCGRLLSKYENFEIPQEIRDRGHAQIIEFRKWFETVKHLLEKPDIFVARLHMRWGIIANPKAISAENSGIKVIDDITIEELEKRIDLLIKDAGRFYYASEKNTKILYRFSKCTFLAYKNERISNNDTGYSESEIRDFLISYDKKYKRPLKSMLIEYYRLKLNPDIKLEGPILENLGFHKCGCCYDTNKFKLIANKNSVLLVNKV
jgi:hypothetical protein